MEELESKCYDKFDFKLEDLQILIAKAGNGDWVCTKFCALGSVSRPAELFCNVYIRLYTDILGHTGTDETI